MDGDGGMKNESGRYWEGKRNTYWKEFGGSLKATIIKHMKWSMWDAN